MLERLISLFLSQPHFCSVIQPARAGDDVRLIQDITHNVNPEANRKSGMNQIGPKMVLGLAQCGIMGNMSSYFHYFDL